MSRLMKTSKYRHTTATEAKKDKTFMDLKIANIVWDCSNHIDANTKYFAYCWAATGAGKLIVSEHDKPGKSAPNPPAIVGHTGQIIDWKFHPYNQQLITTASEDCTIKVWQIPEGGMTEDMKDPMVTHEGHSKKVGILQWHPSAEHVLASASVDHTVRLWDIEKGERAAISGHTDQITSVNWNLDGSLIQTTSKDKKLRTFDPRSGECISSVLAHEGTKTCRSIWAKRRNQIVTTGFSKKLDRQIYVWDPRSLEKPIHCEDIDQASGVLMPFYDEDTNMLYIGGKGDGNIRYYELWDEATPITELECYASTSPSKGLCMLPKTALDIKGCELARFLKLQNKECIPISFRLPRKTAATEFQNDVYPPTFADTPAMTATEFFKGQNAEPKTVNMEQYWSGSGPAASSSSTFNASTVKMVTASDITAAEGKVAEAEKALEAAKKALEDLNKLKKEQEE